MIYFPQEDSEIVRDELIKFMKIEKPEKVLDLGTGSGILAIEAAKIARHIDAVDVNAAAINFVKEQIKKLNLNNVNVFKSDLFDSIGDRYNLIVFNPPYLPEDESIKEKWLKYAIFGGKRGNETIIKFLREAKNFLLPKGKIIFCFSSLSNKREIDKALKNYGYEWELLRKERFWFEDFYVYLAWQKEGIKDVLR